MFSNSRHFLCVLPTNERVRFCPFPPNWYQVSSLPPSLSPFLSLSLIQSREWCGVFLFCVFFFGWYFSTGILLFFGLVDIVLLIPLKNILFPLFLVHRKSQNVLIGSIDCVRSIQSVLLSTANVAGVGVCISGGFFVCLFVFIV